MQHPALDRTDHRPWPLPEQAWTWRQSWCDLLFAHWPVSPGALSRFVPPGLALQTFDGAAWIGVVPFRMEGVMRRPLPDVPGVSAFPELNVRTYVEAGDKPGVLFLSLDATSLLAVCAARVLFALPYWWSRMACGADGDGIAYRHARRWSGAAFEATYGPEGAVTHAAPGGFEHWLTERYCLYAPGRRGALWRTEVHHGPWPLQPARAEIARNTMLAPLGIALPDVAPTLHFARHMDVVVYPPERVR
jgi:uncharacterized protein YqjF (DUF2071 family)